MKRRDLFPLLTAALHAPVCRASGSAGMMEAAADLIGEAVRAGTVESAVLHARRGQRLLRRSFGKAGTENAVFLLASITKPMTAAAVMRLVDAGELRLEERVARHLPEMAGGRRGEITLKHLLTHTSGLPDQLPENAELRRRQAPLDEFVKAALRTPLLFAPGARYQYQSMGILLAAEVVERVSGRPLPEFLATEVLGPLRMQRTALGLGRFRLEDTIRCQTELAAPESGGGAAEARGWDWNSAYWRQLAAPWGGAHGSAGDVAAFLECFLKPDGRVLKPETARLMVQNHTAGLGARRGLGFALGPEGFGKGCSAMSFGHGGATGTLAWADPASDTTCVILTSLPMRVSGEQLLRPVSDVVSAG